jgi:hypothetical protein
MKRGAMGKELTQSSSSDNDLEAAVRSCMKKIGDVFNAIRNGESEVHSIIDKDIAIFGRKITISTRHNWKVGRIKNCVVVNGPEEMIEVINRLLGEVDVASKKLDSTILEIDPLASSNKKLKQFLSSH